MERRYRTMFVCPLYREQRELMLNDIELIFVRNNVPPKLRSLNIETFISYKEQLDQESAKAVVNAVTNFRGQISAKILY